MTAWCALVGVLMVAHCYYMYRHNASHIVSIQSLFQFQSFFSSKCNCLFSREDTIYGPKDHYNDGTGDNPAYEGTPQSSVGSNIGHTDISPYPNGKTQPNGKRISFKDNPDMNGDIRDPRKVPGLINKALSSKPLASFRKNKYRPDGGPMHKKLHPKDSFFTDESGNPIQGPIHTFGPQEPQPFEESIVPTHANPVSSVLPMTDQPYAPREYDSPLGSEPPGRQESPYYPDTQAQVHRTSSPPGPAGEPHGPAVVPVSPYGENNNVYETPPTTRKGVPSPATIVPQQHQPVGRVPSPQTVAQPGGKPTPRPYVAHPDYPHYGNIAPPFNVSSDSIMFMDTGEDIYDDFFLRQKRKPVVTYQPDTSRPYEPFITRITPPESVNSSPTRRLFATPPPIPEGETPARIPKPEHFRPISTPAAPAKPNPFANMKDDSIADTSPLVNDIMQTPLRDSNGKPTKNGIQSPLSDEFVSPQDTPTHRGAGSPLSSVYTSPQETPTHRGYTSPVSFSSMASTPTHSGYKTPPEAPKRRSSASPMAGMQEYMTNQAFETDV